MIVAGIDVGTRNLGLSVIRDGKFVYCAVATLKKKVPINDEIERLAEYVYKRFGRIDITGIEKQMRGRMAKVEIFLEKAFERYSKVVLIVRPQAVKQYYNYSGLKKYADRKRVGTEKFMALCRQLGQYESIFCKAVKGRDKLDDVSDASLIAFFVYAEPSLLNKKKRKKPQLDLNGWAKDRIWCVEEKSASTSKKRKLER